MGAEGQELTIRKVKLFFYLQDDGTDWEKKKKTGYLSSQGYLCLSHLPGRQEIYHSHFKNTGLHIDGTSLGE